MIFSTITKFDGIDTAILSFSQIKQIAGRAGRYNTEWPEGIVSAFQKSDLEYVKMAMTQSNLDLKGAGLLPSLDQVQKLSALYPELSIAKLLEKFRDFTSVSAHFFLNNLDQQLFAAEIIQKFDMTLKDQYLFINAPFNHRLDRLKRAFIDFAMLYSQNSHVRLEIHVELYPNKKLLDLEIDHRIVMLYMWLSIRFPSIFHQTQKAQELKMEIEARIQLLLQSTNRRHLF